MSKATGSRHGGENRRDARQKNNVRGRTRHAARSNAGTKMRGGRKSNTGANTPARRRRGAHAAYKTMMSQYHPDKVAHLGVELQEFAKRKAQEISRAYATLRTT